MVKPSGLMNPLLPFGFLALAFALVAYGLTDCSSSTTTPVPSAAVPYETATSCCGWDTQASIGPPALLSPAVEGFEFAFPTGPSSIHYLVSPGVRALGPNA